MSKHSLERIGARAVGKVEVFRDLETVVVQLCGEQPKILRHQSTANRYAYLTPSQAQRLAHRLINAASKVDQKQDKYGFWSQRKT